MGRGVQVQGRQQQVWEAKYGECQTSTPHSSMKTLSWNCRRIGNDLTVRRLTEMCQKHRLGLLFQSETKNRKLLLQNIQADLGFNKLFTVEPLGQRGGLALIFMDEFQVDILFSNNQMIDVKAVINGIKFLMTFVYGDPVLEKKIKFGNVLRVL